MKLYIWKYTFDKRRHKKIPRDSDLWLSDIEHKKNITSDWISFNPYKDETPPKKDMKLPKILYLYTDLMEEPNFDWLYVHHHIMLVSQSFLDYLKLNSRNNFEISELLIFDKKKNKFNNQNYFAIRIFKFDDDEFEFDESTKKRASGARGQFTYPNLRLMHPRKENVFFLLSFCYNDCLVLTSEGKDYILKNFISPEIYKVEDFPVVFNNQLRYSELPEEVRE